METRGEGKTEEQLKEEAEVRRKSKLTLPGECSILNISFDVFGNHWQRMDIKIIATSN